MNVRRSEHLAVLIGETMLGFRHGADLYTYCPDCTHSDVTPITGQLGCVIGDRRDVVQFSDNVTTGQVDPDVMNCPGLLSRTAATSGIGGPREASVGNSAYLVKQVPSEIEFLESDDEFLDELIAVNTQPTPTGEGLKQREAFFEFLKQQGIDGMDEASAKDMIRQLGMVWQEGVMSSALSPEVVDAIYLDIQG